MRCHCGRTFTANANLKSHQQGCQEHLEHRQNLLNRRTQQKDERPQKKRRQDPSSSAGASGSQANTAPAPSIALAASESTAEHADVPMDVDQSVGLLMDAKRNLVLMNED